MHISMLPVFLDAGDKFHHREYPRTLWFRRLLPEGFIRPVSTPSLPVS